MELDKLHSSSQDLSTLIDNNDGISENLKNQSTLQSSGISTYDESYINVNEDKSNSIKNENYGFESSTICPSVPVSQPPLQLVQDIPALSYQQINMQNIIPSYNNTPHSMKVPTIQQQYQQYQHFAVSNSYAENHSANLFPQNLHHMHSGQMNQAPQLAHTNVIIDPNSNMVDNFSKSEDSAKKKRKRTNYKDPENQAILQSALNMMISQFDDPNLPRKDLKSVSKIFNLPYNTLRDNYLRIVTGHPLMRSRQQRRMSKSDRIDDDVLLYPAPAQHLRLMTNLPLGTNIHLMANLANQRNPGTATSPQTPSYSQSQPVAAVSPPLRDEANTLLSYTSYAKMQDVSATPSPPAEGHTEQAPGSGDENDAQQQSSFEAEEAPKTEDDVVISPSDC